MFYIWQDTDSYHDREQSPKDVRADMQNSALCIIDATVPSMNDIQSRGKQARLRLKISIQDLKKRKEPSYKGDSGRDGGQWVPIPLLGRHYVHVPPTIDFPHPQPSR